MLRTACSIFMYFTSSFFTKCFVQAVQPYSSNDTFQVTMIKNEFLSNNTYIFLP